MTAGDRVDVYVQLKSSGAIALAKRGVSLAQKESVRSVYSRL
ncbi:MULTISPECIES: hypothetical protein [unclassified Coleofasciculus]|nr:MULTISPECIES: hypothetical protein [unclassified Coleofasciculus]